MARPQKRGLDYFPLDVDMDDDTAVAYIEAKHGITGFGIIVKLLMRVYREGYYLTWNERERYVFARQAGVDAEVTEAVVDDCLEEGIFDAVMFAKHGILTSAGIQRRYVQGTQRRSRVELERSYLLLDDADLEGASHVDVSADVNPAQVALASTESTQSKGKESTGEESTKGIVESVVTRLNEKAGTSYRASTPKTATLIRARLKEPYKPTLEDFYAVIDHKCSTWKHDPKMKAYLRPETLFGTKFEGYLNEAKMTEQEVATSGSSGRFGNGAALGD